MAEKFLNIKIQSKGDFIKVNGENITVGSRLEKRLGDKGILQKDVQAIAKMLRDKITSNIYKGKRFDGGNVIALAKSTRDKKKSSRVLIDTGKMLGGVIVSKENGAVIVRMKKDKYPMNVKPLGPRKNTKNKSKGETIEQVAKWINEGTDTMPARPFFGYTKKDITNFTKAVIKDRLFR